MNSHPDQKHYSKLYLDDKGQQIVNHGIREIRGRLSELPFISNQKVLDIACGVSTLGKTFSNNVTGIDLNPESVKIALKNNIKAILADVEKPWPLPNNSFDIVIASHIIEHLLDPDKMTLQSKRVLKKGGKLIIWTPNLAAWFNRILLLFGTQPFFMEVSTVDKTVGMHYLNLFNPMKKPIGHLRIFTLSALKDILILHGFKITMIKGSLFLTLPWPLNLIDKLFSFIPPLASTIAVVAEKQ